MPGGFAQGWTPIVADVVRPATLVDLPRVTTVVYAVGFDRAAGRSIHEVYVNGLAAVLDALPADSGKFIYVSSTGVYGSAQGDWIDEQTPCHPDREGGRACLAAEQVLGAHPLGDRGVILRMAGLYGPGRIPRMRELLAGAPLPVPAAGYLNLIHVDDAAQVVLAAAERAAGARSTWCRTGIPCRGASITTSWRGCWGLPRPSSLHRRPIVRLWPALPRTSACTIGGCWRTWRSS